MSRTLIIGAGGVGSVVAHKCAMVPEIFSEICLASRTVSKCDDIASSIKDRTGREISTSELDADTPANTVALIEQFKPDIVINVALPYQDLAIMDACLNTGVNYMDTANYEPPDEAKFCYKWQWDYQQRFKDAGLTALLGCGFDPGVTGIFCAHALKHHFDQIETIDILDCNAGDHGQAFATNFNPEINIREVTQRGKYYQDGGWIETEPLSEKISYEFTEGIGHKDAYLMYHEELESLAKNIPGVKRIRFYMTFSESYLNHLRVLEAVGMTRIDPVLFEGHEIVPLKFLKAVLPEPSSLGKSTRGKTWIGCEIGGMKDGERKSYRIYNSCDHQTCFDEVGSQAISYTTGVPAMIGAMMLLTGKWEGAGVFNVEEFDPDPFMEQLSIHGLPWIED